MSNLEFFKKQAKNFLKDWQTQTITTNTDGSKSYHYDWKFYDVDYHFNKLKLDDKDRLDIKLARSQHWLAQILGQKNWNVLISLTDFELDKAEDLLRSIKNQKDETKGTPKVQIIPCFRVRCQFEMTLNDKAQFKIAFPKIKAKIIESIKKGYVTYVINSVGDNNSAVDGKVIRRAAIDNNVAVFTCLDTVKVLLDVLEEITMGISVIDKE